MEDKKIERRAHYARNKRWEKLHEGKRGRRQTRVRWKRMR